MKTRTQRFDRKVAEISASLLFFLCVLGAAKGRAQMPRQAEAAPIMKKLGAMTGEWRGTSWALTPQGRATIDSWEKVESKLNGLALFVHGRHTSLEKADSGRVVHEAVGMLYYDGGKQELKFVPVRFDGGVVETWAKDHEKGMQWGFAIPGGAGQVRYTVDISQPDTWVETGEFSRDGTQWLPTMQLNLKRVK